MYVNVLKVNMKRTNIVIDEKLIKDGMKATEIKTRRALVDYALRGLLLREPQKRILELERKVHCERDLSNELERKHREGYRCKPFKDGEFNDWAAGH
jgi:Arc/MetJ family transcription regulator